MTSVRGYFAHVAEMKKRKEIRASWQCSHHPLCPSLGEHDVLAKFEADAKAQRIAETIAHTKSVERLMRFIIEPVDPSVTAQTTASELVMVSEMVGDVKVPTHYIARGPDRVVCLFLHEDGDTSDCADAIRAVLAHKLADSLRDCAAPTPE